MGTAKKTTKLRQQASVEAEVARSRLSLATQDIEKGEKELAFRRSVEASFDAGVAHGYASEAKQKVFITECKTLLVEAQTLAARVSPGAKSKKSCDSAYKAGTQYAKARSQNKDAAVQSALALYESTIEEVGVGRMTNPQRPPAAPKTSIGRLKAKLLR
jgi:hypothetical protein